MLKYPYLLERSYKFVTPDVEYVLPTIIPVRVFNKVRHLCLGLFYGAMLECFGYSRQWQSSFALDSVFPSFASSVVLGRCI